MCGIVGAVSSRNIPPILLKGLERLEYRGYDSAGLALLGEADQIICHKIQGKVAKLVDLFEQSPARAHLGIAHTRWATHGVPSTVNAHPHVSRDAVAVVHNGIIENHDALRQRLLHAGYDIASETDSELIAHLVHLNLSTADSLKDAVCQSIAELEGAYAIAVISKDYPDRLVAARSGSPLVVGIGIDENFVASDQLALRQVTDQFIFLEEGDVLELCKDSVQIWDEDGSLVRRSIAEIAGGEDYVSRGNYQHFMAKEIHEQGTAIQQTLSNRLGETALLEGILGDAVNAVIKQVQAVEIVACGTSFHSGLIAKYWMEELTDLPCHVEIASEFRYRKVNSLPGTLFVTVSQSGETADTLAALRKAKELNYLATLSVCNVANSSLDRESDATLFTYAGIEIGVASTKAFTTQLTALLMMIMSLGRHHGLTRAREQELVSALRTLPNLVERALQMDDAIKLLAEKFIHKNHALFLGRGTHYPIAMEGALKLKEISYIHAEAYPAGELKHGPLALVDEDMPVVAVAPNDRLLEKLKSNLQEVKARGGKLFVFADENALSTGQEGVTILEMPHVNETVAPIVYAIPMQLLAYHVAVLRGTDVDQPRNLAKSVTVE